MNIYPAIKAHMGDWTYYIVRMTMNDVAKDIKLASELGEDRTIDTAIQRTLDTQRVKMQLLDYLRRREDRFFSSLVVASIGGFPSWLPLGTGNSVLFKSLGEAVGQLSFEESPRYYALDGQHRLYAIRELLKNEESAPENFGSEQISVIVVTVEHQRQSVSDFLPRYRRLFSSLNRYAKPTDADTNIIMDEDDMFAILTRRLIMEHEFFRSTETDEKLHKVKTKGNSLGPSAKQFTTLQTLYAVNETFLCDTNFRTRLAVNINKNALKQFKQFRPTETEIDENYEYLCNIWDQIFAVLPDLHNDPAIMRAKGTLYEMQNSDERLHLLFTPIGQVLFSRIVREILDAYGIDDTSEPSEIGNALGILNDISFELRRPPWAFLLAIPAADKKKKGINYGVRSWKMRSEDRKIAIDIAYRILRWMVQLDTLSERDLADLNLDWKNQLISMGHDINYIKDWEKTLEMKDALSQDVLVSDQ